MFVLFRLLDVYGFFLQWCPAIHDGDTDDDEKSDEDFVESMDSDFSVITTPKEEEEVWFFKNKVFLQTVQWSRLLKRSFDLLIST